MALVPAVQILDSRGRPMMRNSAYESATTARRGTQWNAPGTGPNQVLGYNLTTLRNRSRAAERNSPWLWAAIDKLVSNEVGVGVTLRPRAKDKAFRAAAADLWERSRHELDPEGTLDFGGLQSQAVRARRVAGEVFIRRRRRANDSPLAVPLQIQILEAEFVPIGDHRDLPDGNSIRDGIEFDNRGARVAYWVWTAHPCDDSRGVGTNRQIRVPAADIIHHYLPVRPGQRRGEPNAARSLLPARTFDTYEDAELMRKQTRAPFTGAVYREAYTDQDWRYDPFTGQAIANMNDPQIDVEPGTFLGLAPGEKMQLFDADDNGSGLDAYSRTVLLKICAGFGVPFELVTGDWSKVNDRLVRAVLNEFHRSIEAAQDHLLIHQLCLGAWAWWMDAAVFAGRLNAPGYATRRTDYTACQARPHGWRYVNPSQDVDAKIKAIGARLTSRITAIDEQPGPSAEEIDAQIADDPFGVLAAAVPEMTNGVGR